VPRSTTFTAYLHRLVAVGAAVLVSALTVSAASPELHEHVHDATHTHHDESCPIVLFASSADAPAAPVTAPAPLPTARTLAPVIARGISLSLPRYLHPPERGPPASLIS
jgi:hypothetical protein